MAGLTLAAEAVLLTRQPSGERGDVLTFLAADQGLLRAFKRASTRSRQPAPDLFDEVSLRLEKSKTGGDFWFISEYEVRRRRPGIGKHYQSLVYACRYGLLLSHHIFESGESSLWLDQLRQALDAWETGDRPEVVYFKALYLFARQEGIPVKEEWLQSQRPEDRTAARAVLAQPVAGQTTERPRVERLIPDFEHYLEHIHDVRFTAARSERG